MKLCKEKNDTPILVYSFIFFVGNPFKYTGSFNISNVCTEILNSYIWAVIELFVGRWDWRRLCYSTNCLARSEYPATSRWRFSVSRPTVHQWERGAGAADAMTESYAAETGLSPATVRWLFSASNNESTGRHDLSLTLLDQDFRTVFCDQLLAILWVEVRPD